MHTDGRKSLYRDPATRIWYADIERPGGQHERIDLDTFDLKVAQRKLAALAAGDCAAGDQLPTGALPHRVRVEPGCVEWALGQHLQRAAPDLAEATRGAYAAQAGHVVRLLGRLPVAELRREHIDRYIALRTTEGVGAETRRKELILFRAALRCVRDLGVEPREAEGTLFPRLKSAYVPRDRWLTFEAYQLVFGHLPPHRQLQLLVACFTGARRAELMRMRWEDIDWQRSEIVVHQTKPARSTRRVPLPAELKEVLEQLRQPSGKLLRSFNNFYRELDRAAHKAGVAHFSLNDCRRTFASWMLQGGVPLYDVSKLLGHRSIAMLQKVYGHLSDDSLRRAVEKLPRSRSSRED